MTRTTRYLILFLFLILPAAALRAQTTLPYLTGFDNGVQQSGWQQFRKGATDHPYEWKYSNIAAYTPASCLTHNYPVGGTTITDDWFVSPAFSLPAGGSIDSLYCAFTGFGVPGTGDTVAVYLLTGNADPALATARTLLRDYRDATYGNDNTWRNTTPLTIPATSGSCYIAIRYKTVANWLDVRFDNIRIRSNTTTAIHPRTSAYIPLQVYPNPAGDILYFRSPLPLSGISIYDLSGRLVQQTENGKQADVSALPSGSYIAEGRSAAGETARALFIRK